MHEPKDDPARDRTLGLIADIRGAPNGQQQADDKLDDRQQHDRCYAQSNPQAPPGLGLGRLGGFRG